MRIFPHLPSFPFPSRAPASGGRFTVLAVGAALWITGLYFKRLWSINATLRGWGFDNQSIKALTGNSRFMQLFQGLQQMQETPMVTEPTGKSRLVLTSSGFQQIAFRDKGLVSTKIDQNKAEIRIKNDYVMYCEGRNLGVVKGTQEIVYTVNAPIVSYDISEEGIVLIATKLNIKTYSLLNPFSPIISFDLSEDDGEIVSGEQASNGYIHILTTEKMIDLKGKLFSSTAVDRSYGHLLSMKKTRGGILEWRTQFTWFDRKATVIVPKVGYSGPTYYDVAASSVLFAAPKGEQQIHICCLSGKIIKTLKIAERIRDVGWAEGKLHVLGEKKGHTWSLET